MRKKGRHARIPVMKPLIRVGIVAALCCAVAACGSTSTLPTGPGAFRGGGTDGKLAQMSGSTLTLSTANGDVTVTFTSSTSIEKTATGTGADITAGSCISATGTADASGTVTATTVSVSPSSNGSCTLGGRLGGGVNPGGFIGGRSEKRRG